MLRLMTQKSLRIVELQCQAPNTLSQGQVRFSGVCSGRVVSWLSHCIALDLLTKKCPVLAHRTEVGEMSVSLLCKFLLLTYQGLVAFPFAPFLEVPRT